jgi:peptide chain release factor 1
MRQRVARTHAASCVSSWRSTSAAAPATGFSAELVDDRESVVTLKIDGVGAAALFKDEGGGHRWQRVPPNEKRGRVHTSTVTVAVLDEPTDVQVRLAPHEVKWVATRGSGAGGQARNKTSNAIQLWHLPSGVMVRCESERSQAQNLETAKSLLRARLLEHKLQQANTSEALARRTQVGSGMRGDKRRTVRVQDGQVNDHVTGRRWRFRDYVRGDW